MLYPVGPLPASVYWRRRAAALVVLASLLLLLWALLGAGGGGSPDGRSASSSAVAYSPSRSASSASSPGEPSGSLVATRPARDPGRPAEADPAATGSHGYGPNATGTPASCRDSALRLTTTTAKAAYRVGERPVITISLANISAAACVRDLGAAQQEVLLYVGQTRLWSSNDCYPGGTSDIRTVQPGERVSFSVTWSGLSSQPGCAGTRSRVQAGRYSVVGRIGTLRSEPGTLILR